MASEKNLQVKKEIVAKLCEILNDSVAGVIVDYKGISVEDDTKMRRELRKAGVKYFVVKNTMLSRAFDATGYEGLKPYLVGTTAIGVSKTDPVIAAKILNRYSVDSKRAFTIKAGFVEGKTINAAGVAFLAKLPDREELVAQTLRGLNAPISGFATVLNATIRGLVITLDQIANKTA